MKQKRTAETRTYVTGVTSQRMNGLNVTSRCMYSSADLHMNKEHVTSVMSTNAGCAVPCSIAPSTVDFVGGSSIRIALYRLFPATTHKISIKCPDRLRRSRVPNAGRTAEAPSAYVAQGRRPGAEPRGGDPPLSPRPVVAVPQVHDAARGRGTQKASVCVHPA